MTKQNVKENKHLSLGGYMEISFCELRQKEVINVCDGKRLGRVIDMVISLHSCKVLGIVVPGNKKIFNTREDIFISWSNIQKIGVDVLLVQLTLSPQCDDKPHKKNAKQSKSTPLTYVVEDFSQQVNFSVDDE